jgi:hypothetical protein
MRSRGTKVVNALREKWSTKLVDQGDLPLK